MDLSKNYQVLGHMIDDLIDRNQKLEEENERLSRELRILQLKMADLYPASTHSESTDEGSHMPAAFGSHRGNPHASV